MFGAPGIRQRHDDDWLARSFQASPAPAVVRARAAIDGVTSGVDARSAACDPAVRALTRSRVTRRAERADTCTCSAVARIEGEVCAIRRARIQRAERVTRGAARRRPGARAAQADAGGAPVPARTAVCEIGIRVRAVRRATVRHTEGLAGRAPCGARCRRASFVEAASVTACPAVVVIGPRHGTVRGPRRGATRLLTRGTRGRVRRRCTAVAGFSNVPRLACMDEERAHREEGGEKREPAIPYRGGRATPALRVRAHPSPVRLRRQ